MIFLHYVNVPLEMPTHSQHTYISTPLSYGANGGMISLHLPQPKLVNGEAKMADQTDAVRACFKFKLRSVFKRSQVVKRQRLFYFP